MNFLIWYSIEGAPIFRFKDAHDHVHEDNSDPFSHLRKTPFLSIRRILFTIKKIMNRYGTAHMDI